MSPSQKLAEIFDRGLNEGIDALSFEEKDLYLIQDFIIEQEMNGLTGYFYNRLPSPLQIALTIDAMRRHGLLELAGIISDSFQIFNGYTESEPEESWSDVLNRYDPHNKLDVFAKRIISLDNYGLAESSIR